jgi:hypothetical protein
MCMYTYLQEPIKDVRRIRSDNSAVYITAKANSRQLAQLIPLHVTLVTLKAESKFESLFTDLLS